MNEIYAMMIAGLVLIVLSVVLINVITAGWLFTFFVVKASRGKKVLVEVLGATRSYFVVGVPAEGELTYKDASKQQKRSSVNPGMFLRRWGVMNAFVDEETNGIIDFRAGFAAVQGYDNTKADRLVSRILSTKLPENLKVWILVGLVLAVLGSFAAAFFVFQTQEMIATLPDLILQLKDACSSNVI
jgi:hypothetical protein